MQSRPAVLLAFSLGAVLALAGCGGDKSVTKVDTTTATAAAPVVTTPAPPTTSTATTPAKTTASEEAKAKAKKTTTTKQATPPSTRTQTTPPELETSPSELAKRAKANATKAEQGGAKTCPDLKAPAEAKDITVLHISCATARKIIFATTPKERSGFACDIVNESFSDVPAVEYACKRKADKATLGYTAVG